MAVFVDTGAWFAYFVRRDPDHRAAIAWMRQNRQPLVTTDYILDELLTLLKLRENYRVAAAAGEAIWQQRVTRIEYVSIEDIVRTWEVFRQYHERLGYHIIQEKQQLSPWTGLLSQKMKGNCLFSFIRRGAAGLIASGSALVGL